MTMTTTGIHRTAPPACIALAVALLAGCGKEVPAVQETAKPRLDTTAPIVETVMASGDADARLLTFLHQRYGARARLDGAWKDRWEDTEVVAMRPVERAVCARHNVTVDDQAHTLLAVCQTIEDAATVEPGRVDLFVLRDGERGVAGDSQPWPLLVVDQRLQVNAGSDGVPGTVQVATLGPQRPAFHLTQRWNGRGGSLVDRSYVALHSNRLREVARYRDHLDNLTRYDCDSDPEDCDGTVFNIDFNTTVEQQAPVDGYWPITVRGRGQDCAGAAHEFHQLMFDPATRAYQVPEALQRDDCGGS
ncbi:hypothetical protein [Stenotrophomonas maltophilia]|uniref:Uncharacterized protein n=1 Tax=Stenotrophomonas maltophilia TaxID=40324 RepID=A0A4V3RJ41_STEMA|nr:hypothetical protein [Stenotrophomonas maltophilia]TGY34510.1 hypothetical protein E5352_08680 [Stenotrophomonas maltophilia]